MSGDFQGTRDIDIGTPVAVMVEDKADLAAAADYKSGSPGKYARFWFRGWIETMLLQFIVGCSTVAHILLCST